MVIAESKLCVLVKDMVEVNGNSKLQQNRINNTKNVMHCVISLKPKGKTQAFNFKYSLNSSKPEKFTLGLQIEFGEILISLFEKAMEQIFLFTSTYNQLYLFRDLSIEEKLNYYFTQPRGNRAFHFMTRENLEENGLLVSKDVFIPKDIPHVVKEKPLNIFCIIDSFISKHDFRLKISVANFIIKLLECKEDKKKIILDNIPFFEVTYFNKDITLQKSNERVSIETSGLKMSCTRSSAFTYFFFKVFSLI